MADTKTTALTAATSWSSGDLLYLVRDPSGTPVSRKITLDNVLQNLVCSANSSLLKSTTGYSLTGSNASSMIDLAGTWDTTGNPAAIKIAISNTASGATSKFLSFLAGASGTTEVFSVLKDGTIQGPASGDFNVKAVASGTDLIFVGSAGTEGFRVKATTSNVAVVTGNLSIDGGGKGLILQTDTILLRDAANTLALRNSINAQALNVYNTYSSGSVYERGFIRWASNVLEIGTEHSGASARDIVVRRNGIARVTVDASNVSTNGGIILGGDTDLQWTSRVRMRSSTDGILRLSNNADTSFDRLQFGGTTSSFPALKRSSTVLQARLADDSDFAPLQGQLRTHANAVSETPTATHTITMYDASGTAYRVLCLV